MGRTKAKDGTVIPKKLDIDVVTIMPNGSTKEYCDVKIPLEELDTTLHCHSLYYDIKAFEKNETFIFSGTYPNQLRK